MVGAPSCERAVVSNYGVVARKPIRILTVRRRFDLDLDVDASGSDGPGSRGCFLDRSRRFGANSPGVGDEEAMVERNIESPNRVSSFCVEFWPDPPICSLPASARCSSARTCLCLITDDCKTPLRVIPWGSIQVCVPHLLHVQSSYVAAVGIVGSEAE